MRRLFGCPDIVSLTEKFLMARNFYRIFGWQQNLWYSRSEGVKGSLRLDVISSHWPWYFLNLSPFNFFQIDSYPDEEPKRFQTFINPFASGIPKVLLSPQRLSQPRVACWHGFRPNSQKTQCVFTHCPTCSRKKNCVYTRPPKRRG